MKSRDQQSEYVVSVKNLSKRFTIPHEKINTLKGAFVNLFQHKSFETFYALKNVSFNVRRGECFGIIGRNGSGKSTLLKILAGVYAFDSGDVILKAKVSPFLELGIGFNPELSGRDNIYLNASVLGLSKKMIDRKFNSIVAFSELERFIDQKIKNYSSGMQMRLAFSVSIHANRDILLMDEVLAVGDSNFQAKCLREFVRYKEMGKTVILVTHDTNIVQRYCDRALFLRNGEVVMIGGSDEVSSEYVYQNMSDEEKLVLKEQEQKRKQIEREKKEAERHIKQEGFKTCDQDKKTQPKTVEESKSQQEEEKKTKIAEITHVEFLDSSGRVKNVFETGESVEIKVHFKTNKASTPLHVGIGMHSSFGPVIFGYNTEIDDFRIQNSSSVSLHLDAMPILRGEYYVNVTLYGKTTAELYDYKGKCAVFTIFSTKKENRYGGLVSLKHQWKD